MNHTTPQADRGRIAAGRLSAWEIGDLPQAPRTRWSLGILIGPGLVMAGAAIGGGEWLLGPAMTAKYGATFMWIAAASILLQACYNQEVMRYTLYCGEPIPLGCFRTAPGPVFWTFVYLVADFGAIWPYLAANAAVPLTAAYLGHIPGAETDLAGQTIPLAVRETQLVLKQRVSYVVYLMAFIPLIFGGKVYNALEKLMTVKVVFVLSYLTFIGLWYVSADNWLDIFAGFIGSPSIQQGGLHFQWLPRLADGETFDFTLLATFAAIAGAGGLNNANFSSYCRDKGWGMGREVGAIPSAVGGARVALSHTGKVFQVNAETLERWRQWMRVIKRDQWGIWVVGCLLGVAIPSLVSLEFIGDLGRDLSGHEVAAVTARLIAGRTGSEVFWWLTLLCGFVVLGPSLVTGTDGFVRRWTDIIWVAVPAARRLQGNQVKYIYYGLLAMNGAFGFAILTLIPNPFQMVKLTALLLNYGLAFSALHTLVLNCSFLPPELQPSIPMRLALVLMALFFLLISLVATHQFLGDNLAFHLPQVVALTASA